jgi:hypothetical protein
MRKANAFLGYYNYKDSSFSFHNQPGSPSVAIFYNTFVKPDANTMEIVNAQSIFEEQFKAIQEQPLLRNAAMYYSRFGKLQNNTVPQLCARRQQPGSNSHPDCVEVAAALVGDESITIQAMYEYCQENSHHKDDLVIYMHSKGSYTDTPNNHQLRQLLTRAVTSDGCLQPIMGKQQPQQSLNQSVHHDQCDTCSTQLSVYPFPHYVGNMFVAKCDYIRKLIPPSEYESRKSALVHQMWNSTQTLQDANNKPYFVVTNLDVPLKTNYPNETSGKTMVTIQYMNLTYGPKHEYQYTRESWLGSK